MTHFTIDPKLPLMLDDMPSEELTASVFGKHLADQSQLALNHAMSNIYNMALGLHDTVHALRRNSIEMPEEIEMNFGLVLDSDLGSAFIAKAGADAEITVKLKWAYRE